MTPFWTPPRDAYLRQHYPSGNTAAIAAHLGVSRGAVQQRARRLGVSSVGRFWTAESTQRLVELYPDHSAQQCADILGMPLKRVQTKAAQLKLKKSREWIKRNSEKAQAVLVAAGAPNRFKAGHAPWNKGTHFTAGGRSVETRFKPGNKPQSWHPIGHVRVTRDGIVQRKFTDTGRTQRDYVGIHHLVWRLHGRSIPPGHILVFADRNQRNFDINNLECITRAENMRRNSVHTHMPPEIAALVQLRGVLMRQINRQQQRATP